MVSHFDQLITIYTFWNNYIPEMLLPAYVAHFQVVARSNENVWLPLIANNARANDNVIIILKIVVWFHIFNIFIKGFFLNVTIIVTVHLIFGNEGIGKWLNFVGYTSQEFLNS